MDAEGLGHFFGTGLFEFSNILLKVLYYLPSGVKLAVFVLTSKFFKYFSSKNTKKM